MSFLGAAIGGLGSLFGGLFGGSASEQAAQEYEQALQQGENFLEGQETQGLQNYQPYLNAGSQATGTLASLLGTPGQGLLQNWTQQFTPLTGAQVAQTPGYQFQLQQGENALQNSAAGTGSLLSGRTLAVLNNYAQGTANTAYQQYGVEDPLLQYQSAYNTFLNNQNNQYSRLMGLSNEGLSATQGAGQFMTGMGGDIASLMGQKGAAAAAGTIGQANAYGSILPGIGNAISGYSMLSALNGGGFGGGGYGGGGGQFDELANYPGTPAAGGGGYAGPGEQYY